MHVLHLQFIHRWKKTSSRYFSYQMVMFNNPHPSSLEIFPVTTRCHLVAVPETREQLVYLRETRFPPWGFNWLVGDPVVWATHWKKKTDAQVSHWIISPSFRANNFSKQNNFESPRLLLTKVFNSCSPEKKKSYPSGPNKKERDPSSNPTATILLGIFWPGWPDIFWGSFLMKKKKQHFHSFIHEKFPSFFRGQAENEHFFMGNQFAGNKKWIENGFLHIGNWTFATCWKELPFSKSPLVVSILNFHIVSI